MGAYPIGIVGESFHNDDGSSRQTEIARCRPGEPVKLEREPTNKYDANCVKVISTRGVQIGNISRDDAWICERLDKGGFVDARILSIGLSKHAKAAVVLCVRTIEDDEWLPDAANSTEDGQRSTTSDGAENAKGCAILPCLIFSAAIVPILLVG